MNEWPERYTQKDLQQIIHRTGIDPMIEETGIKRFVVRCPSCISDDVQCIANPLLNKLIDRDRRYSCNDCGVVFTWEEAEIEIKYLPHNNALAADQNQPPAC